MSTSPSGSSRPGAPRSQRASRSDRGPGRTPRAVNTAEHQARLSMRLTPRDRWLIRMLHEHKVLSSTQIEQVAFPSPRSANQRLLELYRWRVLDRFQPFRAVGSAPMHYVLDTAGATVLAAEHGLDAKALGYRHERAIGIAHSLHLAHTLGVNGLHTALIAIARHSGSPPATATVSGSGFGSGSGSGSSGRALTTWWSETRCTRLYGDLVRPDGYARWREQHREIEFFCEYDTGSENLTQLAAKLCGYHALAAATGIRTPVLFWLPTLRRETTARRALTVAVGRLERPGLVPVATSAAELTHTPTSNGDGDRSRRPSAGARVESPAGARWLPLGPAASAGRVRLAALTELWPWAAAHHDTTHHGTTDAAETVEPVGGGHAPARRGVLPAPDPTPPDPRSFDPRSFDVGSFAVGSAVGELS